MERRIVNPWTWQDRLGYVQANEISGMERVLVCAGQTSVDADGQPLHEGDMGAQVGQALDTTVQGSPRPAAGRRVPCSAFRVSPSRRCWSR